MKKILSLLLAVLAVTSCIVLTSCGSETTEKSFKDVTIKEMVDAVTGVLNYDGLVQDIVYKADDKDELVLFLYYLADASAKDKVTDYVFTSPTDYCQTLAIFEFDDTATDEDYTEVRDVVTNGYIANRRSALQMYMPEQYEFMKWAGENLDLVWRQFDNKLVLCIYDGAEPVAAWDAIEALGK